MLDTLKRLLGISKDPLKTIAGLVVELTPYYQEAIQQFLKEDKADFLKMSGGNIDLSPAGINHLAQNMPEAVKASLRKLSHDELMKMIPIATQVSRSGGMVNPTLVEILGKAFAVEIGRRRDNP